MHHDQRITTEEFQAIAEHLDGLVQEFENLPYPEVRRKVFDLLQSVDALHREGLHRLVDFLHDHDQGEWVDRAAEEPIVRTLFTLYDLAPAAPQSQVETALELVRPYIRSHGGDVEVIDVVDGVVHLRLSGACQGCAGSEMTLKRGVTAALEQGFPGFAGLRLVEPELPPAALTGAGLANFIPFDQIRPARPVRRPVFMEVARLADLPPGEMTDVAVDGVQVLLANVAGDIYAVRNTCPGSMAPLHLGAFRPPIVICPWHNEAFDVRTGKRADGSPGANLDVLPIAIQDGAIKLAVNTLPGGVDPAGRIP